MPKIMLVEDDNNLREIYEARLLAEGYEIIAASDGEEALAVAVKEKPDLIISDVMMPKISGFDMLDILRGTPETKNTKVIMMTALSQSEDKERAEGLGADRYLVKSQVTLEDVARVAREVLEGNDGLVAENETAASTAAEAQTTPAVETDQANQDTAATTPTDSAPAPVQPQPVVAPPSTDDAAQPSPDPASSLPEPAVQSMSLAEPPQPSTDDTVAPATTALPIATPEPPQAQPAAEPPVEEVAITDQPEMPSNQTLAAVENELKSEDNNQQPAPISNDTTAAAEATADSAQSTGDEQNVIDSQVNSFVNDEPTPEISVSEDGTIQNEPTPPQNTPAPEPDNNSALQVEPPAETTPTPEPVQTAVDPESQETPSRGKKVIQPLTDPNSKPDLNALLEIQNQADQMNQILQTAGVPHQEAETPVTSETTPAPNPTPNPQLSDNNDQKQDPSAIAL